MTKSTITEVKLGKNGDCPILVQFQNSKFQQREAPKMRSAIFRDHKSKKVAVLTNGQDTYVGKVRKEDNFYKRFLLVRNRKTEKMRLIALTCATFEHQDLKEKLDLDISTVPNVEALNELKKQFGSKRTKKVTEQKERMTMNIDNMKEQLEHTVADVTVDEFDHYETQNDENASSFRPPINRDAETLEQVYNIEDLLPQRLLDSLEDEAVKTLDSNLDELELNSYIKSHLTEIQNSSNQDRIDKCKLLLYINYLMSFVEKPARTIGGKKFIICETSQEVNNHIITNFSVSSGSGRTRPLSMRDKGICYILVLLMIALNYEVDVESVSKNFKLGIKKIKDMCRVLAFTPKPKSTKDMILQLPLPLAVSNTPRKKKRRV